MEACSCPPRRLFMTIPIPGSRHPPAHPTSRPGRRCGIRLLDCSSHHGRNQADFGPLFGLPRDQDGRDLKYFNYSNNSIQARALFHGLTAQQGDQIASYIRSLNVVNPGRPWNPPYQPGPGLDSQPVINWAAGAGLDAVLDTDQEMLNAMFPSGYQDSVFAATSRLNQRETPLPVQLPDWNQWLPGTHPMDAFGSTFTSSGYNTIFQTLSSNLQVLNPAVYVAQEGNIASWFSAFYTLYNQVGAPIWAVPGGAGRPRNRRHVLAAPVGHGEDLGADERVPAGRIFPKRIWPAMPIRAGGTAICRSLWLPTN